jgi:hypothetical protein
MKASVAVLVGLAILAAGFGLHRWLGDDEERARAEAAGQEMAAFCRGRDTRCDVIRLDRISEGVWRFHLREEAGDRCATIKLDEFHVSSTDSVYVGGTIDGWAETACGPEWWTGRDATRRLQESTWARDRKAELVGCYSAENVGASIYQRRFRCRYSHPGGDGLVVFRTTGPDTFAIEPSNKP